MKGLMLRWLYGIKRPFFIALFASLIICLAFASLVPLFLEKSHDVPKVFDPSMWLSTMFIGVILSSMPIMPIISDYSSPCFGKYIAVMPVSHRKYISALFLYFGIFTLFCSIICTMMPICYMIASDTFEWKFLVLGFSFVFSVDLFVVLMLILIEVAVSSKIIKFILSLVISVGTMFCIVSQNPEDPFIKNLNELITNGNYYFMSLGMFVITAALAAVIWCISCMFYKRREF